MKFQFQSLQDFFNMSGHGPYVWACYGLGLILMGYLLWSPIAQKRRFLRQLAQREQASHLAGK